jgi:glycosyltransferase involved in cell wall biosynthesis
MLKVSIVIPTRERAEYLYYSIQTALAIRDPDIEILVNDNFSQDNTRAVVESFDDPRLVYHNTSRRLSMRGNYNAAITNSSGDYVIFFGDDDGIVPGQFPFLRKILEEHQPDGVSWMRGTFGWPEDASNKKLGGMRFRKDHLFGVPYRYDPKIRNLDALLQCRLNDISTVSPNIYHGCVSRAYINRIAPEKGVYLNSVIPDVNFEFRATLEGGDFMHVNHMFTVNGFAKKSTGGAHSGLKADETKTNPGKVFETENKTDPYNDLFEHARFVPLALFATLETILDRGENTKALVDYNAWYKYILQTAAKRKIPFEGVKAILKDYAKQTNTTREFEAQLGNLPKLKRSLKENWGRVTEVLKSLRLDDVGEGTDNTVLTAVIACDALLGDAYGSIQSGKLSRSKAWAETKIKVRAKR